MLTHKVIRSDRKTKMIPQAKWFDAFHDLFTIPNNLHPPLDRSEQFDTPSKRVPHSRIARLTLFANTLFLPQV
tara:strand:- start:224 stop:442 length:219 start_codon:yes stop_codon:yes gene_type:complete